jgi:Leucine-rich repeat (LRR) protein
MNRQYKSLGILGRWTAVTLCLAGVLQMSAAQAAEAARRRMLYSVNKVDLFLKTDKLLLQDIHPGTNGRVRRVVSAQEDMTDLVIDEARDAAFRFEAPRVALDFNALEIKDLPRHEIEGLDPDLLDLLDIARGMASSRADAGQGGESPADEAAWLYVRDGAVKDQADLEELEALLGLYIPPGMIESIHALQGLADMTEWNLWCELSANNLADVEPLRNVNALRWLYFDNNAVTDVSALGGLSRLVSLSMNNNRLEDITPLAGLTSLRRLRLAKNGVRDVASLADLADLRLIDLANNRVRDIGPLNALTQLVELNLEGNHLSSAEGLESLLRLQSLRLSRNRIRDAAPFSGLAELRLLDLAGNSIADANPLAGLRMLNTLDLANNRVRKIEPLRNLTALTSLSLANNKLDDIDPLAPLGKLVLLDLSANRIRRIDSLNGLTDLKVLHLGENRIRDLEPLAGLLNLTHLYLYNNSIDDLAPLVRNAQQGGLGAGDVVWLWGNPLRSGSVDSQLAALRDVYKVTVHYEENKRVR